MEIKRRKFNLTLETTGKNKTRGCGEDEGKKGRTLQQFPLDFQKLMRQKNRNCCNGDKT